MVRRKKIGKNQLTQKFCNSNLISLLYEKNVRLNTKRIRLSGKIKFRTAENDINIKNQTRNNKLPGKKAKKAPKQLTLQLCHLKPTWYY